MGKSAKAFRMQGLKTAKLERQKTVKPHISKTANKQLQAKSRVTVQKCVPVRETLTEDI